MKWWTSHTYQSEPYIIGQPYNSQQPYPLEICHNFLLSLLFSSTFPHTQFTQKKNVFIVCNCTQYLFQIFVWQNLFLSPHTRHTHTHNRHDDGCRFFVWPPSRLSTFFLLFLCLRCAHTICGQSGLWFKWRDNSRAIGQQHNRKKKKRTHCACVNFCLSVCTPKV